MQYFSSFMLNMHQIQQKSIFGWVMRNFLVPPVKKFFVCVILAFAPFCHTYLRLCTSSHRVRIRHRVYNIYLAQVLASVYQISLAIYCLC